MDAAAALVALPWNTLLTIVAGYVGYYVANVGAREHHSAIDIALSSASFGLLAIAFYNLAFDRLGATEFSASASALIMAALLGLVWRKVGRKLAYRLLRVSDATHSDDLPSAWVALTSLTDVTVSQLKVRMTDGRWLMCSDLHAFASSPNGPCVLGGKGDVLMYVTDTKPDDDSAFAPVPNLHHEGWGTQITYIPADKVDQIILRR